jgi:Ca2+:H+ antiporter
MPRSFRIDPATLNAAIPVAVCVALPFAGGASLGWGLTLLALGALLSSVVAGVHYAEVIALRVGEPFGTLVLALAVTVIEASLIVALMLSGPEAGATLARDTVFATVMIICNGVVGLCLLLGAARHRVLAFRVDGTSPALSVLATMAVLVLVLPSFTSTTPGPTLSSSQLVFIATCLLALYLMFVFVQTVRHREYFLPVEVEGAGEPEALVPPPSGRAVAFAAVLLLVALVAVVGLAKTLAPGIERAVAAAGIPHAAVGVVVALMVLLPETWAAVRAARANRMQTSFNLALGSALATIGLTIPVVAAVVLALQLPLQLGLAGKEALLLALTLLISVMTLSRGRATVMQGAVHLVLFAAFLFLTAVP